jgi:flagellar L-ring protein precursor FlgH
MAYAAAADSLFSSAVEERGNLISNQKLDFKPGDIITVLVQETIDATTESNTNTKKEADVESEADAADNTFLTNPRPDGLGLLEPERLPNWAIEAENEHRTTGRTKRTNRLSTTVSCIITKVHDNGNLDIEGEKMVAVNREDSRLVVRGTVRGRDVTPANTVSSLQLANALIELRGRGPLWNNQRRGLITKILDWFSPF